MWGPNLCSKPGQTQTSSYMSINLKRKEILDFSWKAFASANVQVFVRHFPHLIVRIWWKSNWAQTVRKHKTDPCEFCVWGIAFPCVKNILSFYSTCIYCVCSIIGSVYSLLLKIEFLLTGITGSKKDYEKNRKACIINLYVNLLEKIDCLSPIVQFN